MVEKNEIMKVVDVHPGTTSSLKKCSKNEYSEKSIAKKEPNRPNRDMILKGTVVLNTIRRNAVFIPPIKVFYITLDFLGS